MAKESAVDESAVCRVRFSLSLSYISSHEPSSSTMGKDTEGNGRGHRGGISSGSWQRVLNETWWWMGWRDSDQRRIRKVRCSRGTIDVCLCGCESCDCDVHLLFAFPFESLSAERLWQLAESLRHRGASADGNTVVMRAYGRKGPGRQHT